MIVYKQKVTPPVGIININRAATPVRQKHVKPSQQRQHHTKKERETSRGIICLKICGITLVLIALMALIVVPIAFVFSKDNSDAECNIVSYDASLKFITMSFSEALNDKRSQEYADLSHQFCTDLSSGLNEQIVIDECGTNTDTCSVSTFRAGSVTVGFSIKQFLRKTQRDIYDQSIQLESRLKNAVQKTAYKGKIGPDKNNIFSQHAVEQVSVSFENVLPIIACPTILSLENMDLKLGSLSSNYPGFKVFFQCIPGHRFPDGEVDRVMTCEPTGSWDKPLEPCRVQRCPDLIHTENREFVKGFPEGNTYGSVVITQCDPNYTTDKNNTELDATILHCMENGTWDHELPQCHRFAVDGSWGAWTEWPNCNKCAASRIERTRECNNPPPQTGGASCVGERKETKTCNIDKTCVSVYAFLNGSLAAPSADTDMVFDVELDKSNAFDGTYFTAPETGLFFFTLTLTIFEGTSNAEMKLLDEAERELVSVDADVDQSINSAVVFRDVILTLNEGSKVKVVLRQGSVINGIIAGYEGPFTSISIFSYSGLMQEGGSALTVGLESNLQNPSDSIFEGVSLKVSLGSGYDVDSGIFTASRSGIYLFNFALRSVSTGDAIEFLIVTVNSEGESGFWDFRSNTRPGGTYGVVTLLDMKEGDSIILQAEESGTFYGSAGLDTAMSCFLYDPSFVEPVAFHAISLGFFWGSDYDGVVMSFGYIAVNVGNDFAGNVFRCRHPGIYYINYAVQTATTSISYHLMKNDIVIGSLIFVLQPGISYHTSRSFIFELEYGDVVYVRMPDYVVQGGDPYGWILGLRLQ